MGFDRQTVAAVALAGVLVCSLVAVTVDIGRTTETNEEVYDAVVVFRNDDVQAGYEFETMQAVDRVFLEEDVPVSLGVIAGGLEDDDRTCSYLSELAADHGDQFEIAAHGVSHEAETEFGQKSEFGGHDREVQADKLETMTDRITACTGERPTTFIPPFNTYDETTVDLLEEYGYETASGGEHTRTVFDDRDDMGENDGGEHGDTAERDGVAGTFEAGNVTHIPQSQAFVADWETHDFHDYETLEAAFEAAAENGSIYVQMLHYQTFTEPADRERLREFIRSVDDYGDVRFATLGELGELVRNDEIRYDEGDGQWYVTETTAGDREVRLDLERAVPLDVRKAPQAPLEANAQRFSEVWP